MPPTGSDAYKAIRLEKDFSKQGSSNSSKLFRLLPQEEQEFFLARTLLSTEEIPVFGILQNQDTWILATTRKVTWSRPGFMAALFYSEIINIGLSEMDKLNSLPEPQSEAEREERSEQVKAIKQYSTALYFEDERGVRHEATVAPSNTLFSVWNSILFMVQLERIHPSPQD